MAATVTDDSLIIAREGEITRLTLNRAEKANALSGPLVEALLAAFERAGSDGTRLIVLEGAGRHFCAGFDFTDFEMASDGDLALRFIRIETLLQAIHHSPCETLALAHGRVFGAGADLVASCSRRVAAPDAVFLMPGLRFGVVLGTRRFAARVGGDVAHDILSRSRSFSADEALRVGFLTAVAPKEAWNGAVETTCYEAARLAPAAFAALREATLSDTRAQDMAALAASVSEPGLKERIRTFRESQSAGPKA